MHNSDPTPQGVDNRNILLWFKCVLTALHVNCMTSSCTDAGNTNHVIFVTAYCNKTDSSVKGLCGKYGLIDCHDVSSNV
jgi:hypothetical protein